jgi:hypothetical protein
LRPDELLDALDDEWRDLDDLWSRVNPGEGPPTRTWRSFCMAYARLASAGLAERRSVGVRAINTRTSNSNRKRAEFRRCRP